MQNGQEGLGAPQQPVAPPPQPIMEPNMNQPTTPVPPQGKKKTGLIIGIIAGVVVIGGVLAMMFFILPGTGGMTCSGTRALLTGTKADEKYTFYFGGANNTLDKMDMKMTVTIEEVNPFGSVDALYQNMSSIGLSYVTVNKRGDSVVMEAKGVKGDEIYGIISFTGYPFSLSDGLTTREGMQEQLEDKGYKCN